MGNTIASTLRHGALSHRGSGTGRRARRPHSDGALSPQEGPDDPCGPDDRKAARMAEGKLVAIVGATLIDGTGREPVQDSVVLVEGKSIKEVGHRGQLSVPDGCRVVNAAGKTVMPGLIDSHLHISSITMSIEKRLFTTKTVQLFQTAEMMKRTLRSGITTIRDAGTLGDVGFKQAIDMGLVEGPRLIVAGGIGQTGGHFDDYYPHDLSVPFHPMPICDGVPAVQQAARQVLRTGVDFIKLCTTGGVLSPADSPEYTEWTLDELKAIVHEAKARDREVMAHAEGNQGIRNAILAGIWSVEHGSYLDDETIRMFLDTGTFLVPTLFIVEEVAANADKMGLSDVAKAKIKMIKKIHSESFMKAAAAGVRIATGTDSCTDAMHGKNARELEWMVYYGSTPMQAIVAATKTAAEVCRIADVTGTLEPGKMADLLVVDGNPLADVTVLQQSELLSMVMKEGTAYVDSL
jgi:imidazolonepropionase-like amidohydrolase